MIDDKDNYEQLEARLWQTKLSTGLTIKQTVDRTEANAQAIEQFDSSLRDPLMEVGLLWHYSTPEMGWPGQLIVHDDRKLKACLPEFLPLFADQLPAKKPRKAKAKPQAQAATPTEGATIIQFPTRR